MYDQNLLDLPVLLFHLAEVWVSRVIISILFSIIITIFTLKSGLNLFIILQKCQSPVYISTHKMHTHSAILVGVSPYWLWIYWMQIVYGGSVWSMTSRWAYLQWYEKLNVMIQLNIWPISGFLHNIIISMPINTNHPKNSVSLKLTFWQYPAIHTNYIISHCTTLQYNHNIWHDT